MENYYQSCTFSFFLFFKMCVSVGMLTSILDAASPGNFSCKLQEESSLSYMY